MIATSVRALVCSTLVAAVAGCSQASAPAPAKGRIVVALTIDWEGADLSSEGFDAVDKLRKGLGPVPITHFVSAAYFTKTPPDPDAIALVTEAVRAGDELAVHLHAWRSLAQASHVEPKLSPSFLSGTDELAAFDDGDAGFDTDLDVYSEPELRAILRTSRRLLEQTHLPVSSSFRAGGYLGTPKILQAIHDEGYTVDSSAIDYRQLAEQRDTALPSRVQEIWPAVTTTMQPALIHTAGGDLLEMPIAAIADYTSAESIAHIFDAAHAALASSPTRDVFVVLGFHLETAAEFAGRLTEALTMIRARRELANELFYTTIDQAAELARSRVPAS